MAPAKGKKQAAPKATDNAAATETAQGAPAIPPPPTTTVAPVAPAAPSATKTPATAAKRPVASGSAAQQRKASEAAATQRKAIKETGRAPTVAQNVEAEGASDDPSDVEEVSSQGKPAKKHRSEGESEVAESHQLPLSGLLVTQPTKWALPSIIPAWNRFATIFNEPWNDVGYMSLLQGQASAWFHDRPNLAVEYGRFLMDEDHRRAVTTLNRLVVADGRTRARAKEDGMIRKVLRTTIAIYLAAVIQTRPLAQWKVICHDDVEIVKQLTQEYLDTLHYVPGCHMLAYGYPMGEEVRSTPSYGVRDSASPIPMPRLGTVSPSPIAPSRDASFRASSQPGKPQPKSSYLKLKALGLARVAVEGRCWACLRPGHTAAKCGDRHPEYRADNPQHLLCRAAVGEIPLPS